MFCASVTAGASVGLFDRGTASGVGAGVTGVAVVAVPAVVATIGASVSGVAFEAAPVAQPDAILELSVRRVAMAAVSLFLIDAIISAAGFGSGASVGACVGAGIGICVGVWANTGGATWGTAGVVAVVTGTGFAGFAAATTVVALAGTAAFGALSGATGMNAGVLAGSGSAASR